MKQTQNQFFGKKRDLPNTLEEGSIYVCIDSEEVYFSGQSKIPSLLTTDTSKVAEESRSANQGYYALLTDFYFGGLATETNIELSNVNTWVDVNIDISESGLFDSRPRSMVDAQPEGHEGTGASLSPVVFKLEGLDLKSFANFRASISFEPEDDEGQLESRLLFNRHSGTTPSEDFAIEEVSLSMFNGADVDYVSEPMLSFFVGDTIDTNEVGDAGKCKFQIKSNVTGILKLRALTWYINR